MTTVTVITGRLNPLYNNYEASNSATWSSLSGTTWATWTAWNSSPTGVTIQLDDDLLTSSVRTPTLSIAYDGEATYELKVSSTGSFAGEETTINFVSGTSYNPPAGRYYRWTIAVVAGSTGLLPRIRSWATNYSTDVVTEYQRNINTASLSGTQAARTVTTNLGTVYSCDITSYEQTGWTDRFYAVPDTWTNPTTIAPTPGIVSNSPLTIVLRDYFGATVDGYVDITIRGVPKITIQGTAGINIL